MFKPARIPKRRVMIMMMMMEMCKKQVRPVRWPSTGSNGDQNWCGKKDIHDYIL